MNFFSTSSNGNKIEYPLSVTLQITRKCNLQCLYCSESEYIPEISIGDINKILENLNGVKRIIISGGEPTLREDLELILRKCREKFDIVSMSFNASNINIDKASSLIQYLDYVDVTIDGPRKIHNKIRGSYDEIIRGLWILKQVGMKFSIVTVLMKENVDFIFNIVQIADVFEARKLKILSPINKGRGRDVITSRLSSEQLKNLFYKLKVEKEKTGWKLKIVIHDWNLIKEGHSLLIHPDGNVVASPVWSNPECTKQIGNVIKENIKKIWENYPYKENHINKYLEKSLLVC